MVAKKVESSSTEECKDYLKDRWQQMLADCADGERDEPLGNEHSRLKRQVEACLRSTAKTYRYVLPTQLLYKCVNPSADCRSIRASFKSAGAFDARSIAHEIVVPFDRENHQVLGGSAEPYVNNPLRCDSVTRKNRGKQKNKADWDKLVAVLAAVQRADDAAFTRLVFDQVLCVIYKMLDDVKVTYPVPNRVSLERTLAIMTDFLAQRSGGDRLEALATALFRMVAKRSSMFDDVQRARVNAADASSGMVADIECREGDKIVLVVEVKDRTLTLVQLDAKLAVARSRKINEIMFMAQGGCEQADAEYIQERIRREFGSGQNIYVVNLLGFAESILVILGESGRVDYLHEVGRELDRVTSPIPHRKAWAALLQGT